MSIRWIKIQHSVKVVLQIFITTARRSHHSKIAPNLSQPSSLLVLVLLKAQTELLSCTPELLNCREHVFGPPHRHPRKS